MQPLTAAQDGIWRGQQLAPGSPLYNACECVFIEGRIDIDRFVEALRAVLDEARVLGHIYVDTDDGPRQTPGAIQPPITVEDLTTAADPESVRRERIAHELAQPIDLARGPLARHRLFIEPDRVVWCQQAHHIALDGYGFALIAQRVAERYAARLQQRADRWHFDAFDDVVAEDLAYTASAQYRSDREFWLDHLGDRPQPAQLSQTPAVPVAGHSQLDDTLDADHKAGMNQLARRLGVSWPDIILAATAEWLDETTEYGDIVIGVPMMDRLGSAAARVPSMGMNILALRLPRAPRASFAERAVDIARRMATLHAHRRYRYEWLRRDLGLIGGSRCLFGPVVNIMPFDAPLDFGGTPGHTETVTAGPVDDLAINIRPGTRQLSLAFNGHPDRYDPAGLEQHAADWRAVLERGLHNPDQRPVDRAIRHARESIVSGPALPATPLLAQMLYAQARHRPAAVAVDDGQQRLDYAGLHDAATRLAQCLRARGIATGDRVAISLPRSPDAVVAMLGAGLAGAVWLALDSDAPAARNQAILDDAEPALVIGTPPEWLAGSRPTMTVAALCAYTGHHDLPAITATDTAYLVYTSGSTGTPKGVRISHGALSCFVAGASSVYAMDDDDRVLQFASLAFDACIEEIFCTLAAGATLIVRPPGPPEAPGALLDGCATRAVSIIDLPTAYWHELVLALEDGTARLPATLRQVIVGGEAMRGDRLASWYRHAHAGIELINTYGPSEATVVATSQRCRNTARASATADAVPIGRPLPGMTAAVVDRRGAVVEQGRPGELVLGGPALAQGYRNRPAATAERFSPFTALGDDRPAYRTGDRVHMDADGRLHFHGRLDDERKISGYRVSPGEIEAVCGDHADIHEVAVTAHGHTLAAHVTGRDTLDTRELRRWLAARLPAPLVPARIVTHARLPRTAGGKIDRARLRAMPADAGDNPALQATPMERCVLEVWSDILGQQGLSPADDFFALGGSSLQTIQVAQRLGRRLGREISVGVLFEYPFAADLASALDSANGATAASGAFDRLLTLRPGRDGAALYCLAPAVGLAWCYTALARHLPAPMRVVGVQSPALSADSAPDDFDTLVDDLAATLKADAAGEPLRLLGWSFGGLLAHAVALRLQTQGHVIAQLILVDAYPGERWRDRDIPGDDEALAALCQLHPEPIPAHLTGRATILEHLQSDGAPLAGLDDDSVARIFDVTRQQLQMARQARHHCFHGPVLFVGAAASRRAWGLSGQDWHRHVDGNLDIMELDTDHAGIVRAPAVATLARQLGDRLSQPATASDLNTTEYSDA